MTIFAGLLLLILFVPCVSTLEADGSSQKSQDFLETFEKRCPPGLWCGKKRGVPEEEAMVVDDHYPEVNAYEKRCPPGLWCGKKRSLSRGKSAAKTNTQIEDYKENLASTFEKRCPPGLWCGKKRALPEEILTAADNNRKSITDTFEGRCPPGLSCGKKRDIPKEEMMETFEKRCPPGLWCGKKRQLHSNSENKVTQVDEASKMADQFEKRCPPGLWCGKKREIPEASEENGDSLLNGSPEELSSKTIKAEGDTKQGLLVDVFEKRCPPGLWCGKKRAITEETATGADEEDDNMSPEAFEKRCPPGLWCGKKRTISSPSYKSTRRFTSQKNFNEKK